MIKACSHLVLASNDVSKISDFFAEVFQISPHFKNDEFCEFVLASRFRIAFFLPTGITKKNFDADASRKAQSIGVTVEDVDGLYERVKPILEKYSASSAGAPKEHPWGEKSFLLVDPDGNRWEVTQSPGEDGMLNSPNN